jgi:hypothetical protein
MQIVIKIFFTTILLFLISCVGPSGYEGYKSMSDSLMIDSIYKDNLIKADSVAKQQSAGAGLNETIKESTIVQIQTIDSLYEAKKELLKLLKTKKREHKIILLKNNIKTIDAKLDSISFYIRENRNKSENCTKRRK